MELNNSMEKKRISTVLIKDDIIHKIFLLRGEKIMLDVHLAEIYGVQNRALKQAVRRNYELFPDDFMFVLTELEIETMVSQNAISSKQFLGGSNPYAFTETGVAMLSSVLKSKRAKEMNIAIMRAFVDLRKMLLNNADLRFAFEEIKRKTENNSKNIDLVFQYLDELMQQKAKPRQAIGFKISSKK